MVASSRTDTFSNTGGYTPVLKVGAIDNSLAFPWKHPDQWRSFPFGYVSSSGWLEGEPLLTLHNQMAFPACITDRAAVLHEDARSFSAITHINEMVGGDADNAARLI